MEKEGWQEVRRRKRQSGVSQVSSLHWSLQPNIVSFFVSNLPIGITDERFRALFSKFRNMVDAYLARKKDRRGNLFGFIRFKEVTDINNLLNELNSLRIDGAILGISIAKYPKTGGNRPMDNHPVRNENRPTSHIPTQARSLKYPPGRYSAPISFKDALLNKNPPELLRIHDGLVSAPNRWCKRSILGKAIDLHALNSVVDYLNDAGLMNAEFRYVGGLYVLITFLGSQFADCFMRGNQVSLRKIFSHVQIWSGEEVEFERIASIKIYGVPLKLWDSKVFDRIGRHFGQIVASSNATPGDGNLSFDRLMVATSRRSKICEEIPVLWHGSVFSVAAVEDLEDWAPSFCDSPAPDLRPAANIIPDSLDGGKSNGLPIDVAREDPEIFEESNPRDNRDINDLSGSRFVGNIPDGGPAASTDFDSGPTKPFTFAAPGPSSTVTNGQVCHLNNSLLIGPNILSSGRPKKRSRHDFVPYPDVFDEIFGPDPPDKVIRTTSPSSMVHSSPMHSNPPPTIVPPAMDNIGISVDNTNLVDIDSDADGPLRPPIPINVVPETDDLAAEVLVTIETGACVGMSVAPFSDQLKDIIRCEREG